MALPASGQISMDDIRVELGVPSQSPFDMNVARQGGYVQLNYFSPTHPPYSGQVSLADWYSYCQSCGYNTVSFAYSSVNSAAACAATSYSTYYYSGTLGIGTQLFLDTHGSIMAGYYSNGTNWYFQDLVGETYEIVSTGTCTAGDTLFYISNSSLDIVITDVKVNGVSLTGATGAGFPVYSGDSINAYSNQLGTQDVDIYCYNSITGQHLEGYDSNLNYYCNSIPGVGSHTIQWGGAYVGSGTFQIYAYDGTGCL
jgi:hypothetical protein